MSIKSLSKAASALALVGVVAPFLVQSVGAADEPTSALSGVNGVTDPSGSQIIDRAVSGNNNSGSASGTSYAGIGFKSGDLILYQVPNFDFSMNNKIAADTYKMITTSNNSGSNRMAVIVDNRYTQEASTANDGTLYNWTLDAKASSFAPEGVEAVSNLTSTDVQVLINDGGGKLAYNVPKSQNAKGQGDKIYEPGDEISNISEVGLQFTSDTNILSDNSSMIAKSISAKTPGPTAINFSNNASAEFVVLPGTTTSGIAKIVPNTKYVSTITWTLSANPLH